MRHVDWLPTLFLTDCAKYKFSKEVGDFSSGVNQITSAALTEGYPNMATNPAAAIQQAITGATAAITGAPSGNAPVGYDPRTNESGAVCPPGGNDRALTHPERVQSGSRRRSVVSGGSRSRFPYNRSGWETIKRPLERRLAAIFAADVAGYSRLMGADEEGTHERLKAHLRELVDPKISEHRGRIVKNTGDGFLAEFPSVIEAVRCGVAIQRAMVNREAQLPEAMRIKFRIGINLGDVIVEEHDIFGDGVNLAARLEALVEPGGVCVSSVVRDQVRDRLPFNSTAAPGGEWQP